MARSGAGGTSYGYDHGSRLQSLAHDFAGDSNDQSLSFAYNPASQIVTRTGSNDQFAWTAHGSGSTATSVNGLNQIASKGGTAFTYDPNGNLTGDGATSFAFDTENRLTSASGAKNATLAYDPMGRLVDVTSAGVATKLLYDGDDLIAEYEGSGTLLRRYVHGPGADEPLVQYEGAGLTTKRHLHADHQGSVIAITDASGNLLTGNRYDEYGVPQATNAGRFQYTGQQWLNELGIYHYKARMYRPGEGVFMQTDPIGYEGGTPNLYVYVDGDPVNKSDPTGMFEDKDRSGNSGCFLLCRLFGGSVKVNGPSGPIGEYRHEMTQTGTQVAAGAGITQVALTGGLIAAAPLATATTTAAATSTTGATTVTGSATARFGAQALGPKSRVAARSPSPARGTARMPKPQTGTPRVMQPSHKVPPEVRAADMAASHAARAERLADQGDLMEGVGRVLSLISDLLGF